MPGVHATLPSPPPTAFILGPANAAPENQKRRPPPAVQPYGHEAAGAACQLHQPGLPRWVHLCTACPADMRPPAFPRVHGPLLQITRLANGQSNLLDL